MLKLSFRLKAILIVILCCVLFGLICGRALWSCVSLAASHTGSVPTHTIAPLITTISIPAEQDLFIPFILDVPLHTTVTWWNDDSIPHFVATTKQYSNFLNPQTFSFRIPADKEQQFTFNEAGLYHYYYCRNHDQVDSLTHRAQALPIASEYPVPMEGFVLVTPT